MQAWGWTDRDGHACVRAAGGGRGAWGMPVFTHVHLCWHLHTYGRVPPSQRRGEDFKRLKHWSVSGSGCLRGTPELLGPLKDVVKIPQGPWDPWAF